MTRMDDKNRKNAEAFLDAEAVEKSICEDAIKMKFTAPLKCIIWIRVQRAAAHPYVVSLESRNKVNTKVEKDPNATDFGG